MSGTGGMFILWPQGQSSREGGGKTSSQVGLCRKVPFSAVIDNSLYKHVRSSATTITVQYNLNGVQ